MLRGPSLSASYLRKLVAFGLAIGIVPLMCMTAIAWNRASAVVSKKVQEIDRHMLASADEILSMLLRNVMSAVTQCLLSPEFVQSVEKSLGVDDFREIRRLERALNRIELLNTPVGKIIVLNTRSRWIVTGGDFFDEGLSRGLFDDLWVRALIERTEALSWFHISRPTNRILSAFLSEAEFLVFAKKVSMSEVDPNASAVIAAFVPLEELRPLFSGTSSHSEMLLLDGSGRALIRGGTLLDEVALPAVSAAVLNAGGGTVRVSSGALRHRSLMVQAIGIRGFFLVSATRAELTSNDATTFALLLLAYCILLCVGVLVIAMFWSRRMYVPIQRIWRTLGGARASGTPNDEVQFIGERIQDLLAVQESLSRQLRAQLPQMREYCVIQALRRQIPVADIPARLDAFGYRHDWKMHAVLLVCPDQKAATERDGMVPELLAFALRDLICDIVPAASRIDPVVIDASVVLVVGADRPEAVLFRASLDRVAESLQRAAAAHLGHPVSVGVSAFHSGLEALPDGLREALRAISFRAFADHQMVLYHEDVAVSVVAAPPLHRPVEQEVISALAAADAERLSLAFGRFCAELVGVHKGFVEYRVPFLRLLIEIAAMMSELGLEPGRVDEGGLTLYHRLLALRDPELAVQWFREAILDPALAAIATHRQPALKRVVEHVKQRVGESLEAGVGLKQLADEMNLHQSYISTVFKRETGQTFSDYVAECRLEVARMWLADTTMPIGEIAHRLHYANTQNFIRYFRRMVGMTPGRYRANGQLGDARSRDAKRHPLDKDRASGRRTR